MHMHLATINLLLAALGRAAFIPRDFGTPYDLSETGRPCGASHGDCPTLTCIPNSKTCTYWNEGCLGTCQYIDLRHQRIYNLCGGWDMYDDCDERVEYCATDPRGRGCGPSCDSRGICIPMLDSCGWEEDLKCRPGLECFDTPGGCRDATVNGTKKRVCGGVCLPLRFSSEYYAKTRLEEIRRSDLDGRQGEEDEP